MKYAVIALALTLGAAPLYAGDESRGGQQRGPHGTPEERLERMRTHLDLTDEQVVQMRAIQESDASRWDKRNQMREVLTEEQLELMREQRAEHGGKRHGKPDSSDSEQYN
ncbi:MAG: hypothetical protein V2I66_15630 [Halieaceae bacterium]|jgi:Spy/CpxP family protein refolding chaperone|nr:hypothetical protein [Halieaceae bacterium]